MAAAATIPTAPAATDDVVTWSVEPLQTPEGLRRSFEYSVDPGTQIQDSVVITNQGATSAEFLIYATDAVNEVDTGAFSLLKRDETPTDVGGWITTASEKLTIEPGMQAIVPFNLLVPSDATPGDHVAGIVASVLTSGDTDGAAVVLEQRVGARVYLNVSGPTESGVELSGVTSGYTAELNPFAPGTVNASWEVRNTGNLRVDVRQTLQVTGPFGIPLGELQPEPITELLPRQTVRVQTDVPAIMALLLAWSTVTAVPGEIGSAKEPLESAAEKPDQPTLAPTETAEATPTATPTSEAVQDTDVVGESDSSDFEPVSATVTTVAISWTLLAVVVLVLVLIYFIWSYVSGTRERMYLAIDEAAAAAREEALSASDEKPTS
jgi:hypothetical protein